MAVACILPDASNEKRVSKTVICAWVTKTSLRRCLTLELDQQRTSTRNLDIQLISLGTAKKESKN
jgi:hypothetical protein